MLDKALLMAMALKGGGGGGGSSDITTAKITVVINSNNAQVDLALPIINDGDMPFLQGARMSYTAGTYTTVLYKGALVGDIGYTNLQEISVSGDIIIFDQQTTYSSVGITGDCTITVNDK